MHVHVDPAAIQRAAQGSPRSPRRYRSASPRRRVLVGPPPDSEYDYPEPRDPPDLEYDDPPDGARFPRRLIVGPPPRDGSPSQGRRLYRGPPSIGAPPSTPPSRRALSSPRLAIGPPPVEGAAPSIGPPPSLDLAVAPVEVGPPPAESALALPAPAMVTMDEPQQEPQLPKESMDVICPNCQRQVFTDVKHRMGSGSWALTCAICLFGAGAFSWLGVMPCCLKDCQDSHHSCPECKAPLGTRKFLF